MATQPMSVDQLAQTIKSKYPDYANVPNDELVSRIVAKYPQYQSAVTQQAQPAQPNPKVGNFSGRFNEQTGKWEDESVTQVPSQPADVRFAKGFNRAVTGASTPQELLQNLGQEWEQIKGEMGQNAGAPNPAAIVKGIHQGMQDLWNRASTEWKQGNYMTAQGLLTKANAAMHFIQAGIPGIGPMLAGAGDQMAQGDVAGGLGTLTGIASPAVAGGIGEAKAMQTGTVTNPQPSAALFSPKTVQTAATTAGAGAGAALGHATGIPMAGELGAGVGAALGRKLGQKLALSDVAEAVPKAATSNVGEAAPASLVLRGVKEGNSPQTARMLASQAYQDAKNAASNVSSDTARAKWAAQPPANPAQASQAVKEVVDEIAPDAPSRVKFEVDYQLRRGDVAAAQKALDSVTPQGPPMGIQATGFRPALQNAEMKARQADIWDDKLWQQRMEDLMGTDEVTAPHTNWADTTESNIAASQQRKVPTSRFGRATYTDAVKQFLENNSGETPKLQGAGNVIKLNQP